MSFFAFLDKALERQLYLIKLRVNFIPFVRIREF